MAEVRESEVLLREVDRCLTRLRLGSDGADLEMAERLASALRRLVTDTAVASAADRAQARSRRDRGDPGSSGAWTTTYARWPTLSTPPGMPTT